jgi:hypothetical protein
MDTIRLLEADEYHKLEGLAPPDEWIPSPDHSQIIVVERDSEIISYLVAQMVVHVEPIWIHPDHRNGFLGRRMWRMMTDVLTRLGVPDFYAFAPNETIQNYVGRLGMKPFAMTYKQNLIPSKED